MKYIAIGGGGFKAYTYVGALKNVKLDKVKAVSGSSAGSIIGFFICLTKRFQKIEDIAVDEKYRIFDSNDIDIHNFFPYYGLNKGDVIEKKLEDLCEIYCGTRRPTFKEFVEKTDSEFYVTTTNLNKGTCEYFSHKTTPDFEVIKAIRMSISIPLYFTPVEYDGNTYIDGSFFRPIPYEILLENYSDLSPENALLIGSKENERTEHNTFIEYILCLFHLIRSGLVVDKKDMKNFTQVHIDTSKYPFIDHKYSADDIREMIEHGSNTIDIK